MVRLEAAPDAARILIDDPAGIAPDWRSVADTRGERNHVPRLGFAWVAQTLATLGGSTETGTRGAPPLRIIVIELPRTPHAPRNEKTPAELHARGLANDLVSRPT